MSARTLRRTFAAPFVVTLALSPASADTPPSKVPAGRNPPGPVTGKPQPAKVETKWTISKVTGKGAKPTQCIAQTESSCSQTPSKVTTCNPPKPRPYVCPTNNYGIGKTFADKDTIKIIQRVGDVDCFIDTPPLQCDPGEKCNPPPPRKIACPK